jgi:Phage ABA sandwich domain
MQAELVAGRELDAEVAEKLFGLRTVVWHGDFVIQAETEEHPLLRNVRPLPYFSTSIGDAWLVVERDPKGFTLENGMLGWEAYFVGGPTGYGETAPLAICRAALGYVSGQPEAPSTLLL